MLDAYAEHESRCFAYQLNYRARDAPEKTGACHAMDLGLVFGTYIDPLLRSWYAVEGEDEPDEATHRCAHGMQRAWTNFAWHGRPGRQLGRANGESGGKGTSRSTPLLDDWGPYRKVEPSGGRGRIRRREEHPSWRRTASPVALDLGEKGRRVHEGFVMGIGSTAEEGMCDEGAWNEDETRCWLSMWEMLKEIQ